MIYGLSFDEDSDVITGLKAYPSTTDHENSYSYLKFQTTNTDSNKHFYAIAEQTDSSEVSITDKITIK
jgi:hypothetical protein